MNRTRALSASVALLIAVSSVGAAQGRGRGHDDDHGRDKDRDVPQQEQQRRIQEEHQRDDQYRQQIERQMRDAEAERARLQQDRRAAQYAAQQRYAEELREQQRRAAIARDYNRDPYIRTPHSYRYAIGGVDHITNQYGVDVLKRAVNYGYQQGYRAGEADRQDRWRASYQNSIAYRDADYGYDGRYVDLGDYSYYFRQGFQRGYDDGYNHRSQFGTSTAGVLGIAAAVLAGILVLRAVN